MEQIQTLTGKNVEQILASPNEFFGFWERVYKSDESNQSVFGLYEDHPENSAIVTFTTGQIVVMLSLIIMLVLCFTMFRGNVLLITMIVLQLIYMLMALAKFYIVICGARKNSQLKFTQEEVDAIDENELPVYTVLIPVYK